MTINRNLSILAGGVSSTGVLGVPNGGSGATTLTGYLIGNGTGAFTASATIPTSALSGTVDLTSQVSGILPIANGGTGLTTLTAGYIPYGNGTSAFSSSAGLTFDGTNLATTGTATATRFIPSGSTVATNGMFLPSANTLGFSTASTEAMRIDSSGNLLVGTTTLLYNGKVMVYNSTANNAVVAQVSSNTSSTFVGVNSSASYTFYVTGAGQIGAVSTSIAAISDVRLKTNIQPIKYGLKTILDLKPVTYDFIENNLVEGQIDNLGFIAQDVQSVIPELVTEGNNKAEDNTAYLTLKMGDMLPVLVKAIQELNTKFDAYVASHP